MVKTILITGCNRGLGFGLIKHLLQRNNQPNCLIATCRDLNNATELVNLSKTHENLHILTLDVTKVDEFEPFSNKVAELVKSNGLNVLFNNAGYSPKYTRLQLVKTEQIMQAFQTNTLGPIMLSKALLPLLKQAATNNAELAMSCQRAAIINMSSILGSLAENNTGGLYPYKCSKAALNMATVSMSIDLKADNILVASLHPGWVKTDMGGKNAPMLVEDSTSSIIDLLYKMDESHNGGFVQWDGKPVPW